MQFLILTILASVAVVSAGVYPGRPYGENLFIPPIPQLDFSDTLTGVGYYDRGFARGLGGSTGSGFQSQGSSRYYNQGENYNRMKQVLERENSSSHNIGGSSQGSSAGQSGASFNSFDNGRLSSGGRFLNTGFYV